MLVSWMKIQLKTVRNLYLRRSESSMHELEIDAKLHREYLEKHPELDKATKEYFQMLIEGELFLAKQTPEGICALFNTGIFNEICKGYCQRALENCELDKDTVDRVMHELGFLFDICTAAQVLK